MRSLTARAVLYGLLILFGLLSALPNVLPDSVSQRLPSWYAQNQVALGLDLRGGSHLLLEVDTRNLLLEENQRLADQLSGELRDARVFHNRPEVSADTIRFSVQRPEQLERLATLVRDALKKEAGAGPRYNLRQQESQLSLHSTDQFAEQLTRDAVERSLEVVRRRLDETGLVDPTITRQGKDGILVQLPGVDDPQQIRKLLGTTAKMTFHWAANEHSRSHTNIITVPGQMPGESYRLEQRVALEGKHVSDARLGFHPLSLIHI